jgi:hypothetical protein
MKKIFLPALLSLLILISFGTNASAASLGQSLRSPDAGWKRFDDNDSKFSYTGEWVTNNTGSAAWYGGGVKVISKPSNQDSIKFRFHGTKLRIIAQTHTNRTNNVQVKIDNEIIGAYSIKSSTVADQALVYEKIGLDEREHSVELLNLNTESEFIFDAIDIDGELLNPEQTPQPEPSSNRAILTVTMITGLEKEFDLPMSEVNAFLNWCDNASGSTKYGINKYGNNKGPFAKRTEYIIFDKILTFEVSEYTAQ